MSSTVNTEIAVTATKSRLHFRFLDGLRGLTALYVVLHHFLLWGAAGLPRWLIKLFFWTQFGHFAVDIFITLSGFCLMLPVARAQTHNVDGGVLGFLGRRARRILPPYWAALAFALLITWLKISPNGTPKVTLNNIVAHVLLVHDLHHAWSQSLDMAMWSIAPEWQIYFVFVLLLLPIWRCWGSWATIAIAFAMGILPHFVLKPALNFDWACPWYVGLFALGMAGSVAASSPNKLFVRHPQRSLWGALFLLIPYTMIKLLQPPNANDDINSLEWIKDALGGSIAICIIFYCALVSQRFGSDESLLLRVLISRPVAFLGSFSYSLYLVHCLVLIGIDRVELLLHLPPIASFLLRGVIGVPVALIVAFLFFLVFERPFHAKSKKRLPIENKGDATLASVS